MINNDVITQLESTPAETAQYLRGSLENFIKVFYYYLTREDFVFKPFHKRIIKKLESVVFDNPRNVIISIPPRFGKSIIMRFFVAWTYTINAGCNNIYTSYSDDLVRDFSGKIRDLINSPLYRRLFGIAIKEDTSNKGLWQITGGGGMRACSMGGSLTGFGAGAPKSGRYGGAIVVDDPMKADDVRSDVYKQHVISYFTDTLLSRRNSENTPVIIIMQRLAVDDLVGWIKDHGLDYDIIEIPALDNGKSIWEERFSTASLKQTERENPYYFAAQYMQHPIIPGGNIIHPDKFRSYKELPDNIQYTKLFADLSMTAKTYSDYSVFLLAGFTADKKMYIIDLWRKKWEVPDLTKFAFALWQSFKNAASLPYPIPRGFCIENKASGTGILQDFKRHGIYVEPLYPTAKGPDGKQFNADKYQRVCDILPEIELGHIYIPHRDLNKVWLNDFLKECREFTADDSHAHDDQVDCLIYAVKELQKPKLYAVF